MCDRLVQSSSGLHEVVYVKRQSHFIHFNLRPSNLYLKQKEYLNVRWKRSCENTYRDVRAALIFMPVFKADERTVRAEP